jgi:hypothetical protein
MPRQVGSVNAGGAGLQACIAKTQRFWALAPEDFFLLLAEVPQRLKPLLRCVSNAGLEALLHPVILHPKFLRLNSSTCLCLHFRDAGISSWFAAAKIAGQG